MTTTEIRLKCLELALNTKGIQPDAFNFIKEAKIYENYLLGITEQTIAKKEEPLPPYEKLINKELLESALRDFFGIGNDKFEVKNEIVNVPNLLSSQQLKDLESYTQRLGNTCNHH